MIRVIRVIGRIRVIRVISKGSLLINVDTMEIHPTSMKSVENPCQILGNPAEIHEFHGKSTPDP